MAAAVVRLTVVGGVGTPAVDDTLAALQAADLVVWANAERRRAGLAELVRDWDADERALAHTWSMLVQSRLFHQRPACPTWGEDVGVGQQVGDVFSAWLRSTSHRDALLLPGARLAGSAVLTDPAGRRWIAFVVCG